MSYILEDPPHFRFLGIQCVNITIPSKKLNAFLLYRLPRHRSFVSETKSPFDFPDPPSFSPRTSTLEEMKVFSNSVNFDYSWEEVSTANWRKYCPWNDKSTHVVAVDTLSREVDPATGILRTERLITCKQSAPQWLAKFMGGNDISHVFEVSYVDLQSKKVTMTSTNLTFSNVINVEETVIYQSRTDAQTQFLQEAKVTAVLGGWQKIKNAIEDASVTRFKENAVKGKEGFERVLEMSRRAFGEEKERQLMSA